MLDGDFWELFRESRNPMVLVDADRRVIEANAAMRALTHRPVDGAAGRPVLDFVVPEDRAHAEHVWDELERTGHAIDEEHLRTLSGATIWFHYAVVKTELPEYGDCYLAVGIEATVIPEEPTSSGAGTLSPREEEIVGLLAHGLKTDEIAEQLVVSPETVRTHVRNAMEKTGARNRAHLVAQYYARRVTV